MSERIVIGREMADDSGHALKDLLRRVTIVGGLVLSTSLQADSLQDATTIGATNSEASPFDSTIEWPFGPGHQELVFTSMGSSVAKIKSDKLTDVTPAEVVFDSIRCRHQQVYGNVTVWVEPSVQYHFSDVLLPKNSFLEDCLLDNTLDNRLVDHLTVGENAYQYVVQR